jgi:hypothetical protein
MARRISLLFLLLGEAALAHAARQSVQPMTVVPGVIGGQHASLHGWTDAHYHRSGMTG